MSSKEPISSLETHLGYWLRTVSNAVSQSFARRVESEGVTVAEWVFLRMLHDCEPVSPSLLAERMGITKGAISKLADRLSEKGLVARKANSNDTRGQTLALQPAARSLVPRLAALADKNDAEFFGSLTGEERHQLQLLLRKVSQDRDLKTIPTT